MTDGRQQFLDAASAIGAGLCRDALWDSERCNWLGDVMEFCLGSWQVVHRTFAPELYGGTSGIALFLARLYQATGERLLRTTAEGAMAQVLSRWETLPESSRLSYYAGSVGIADALAAAGDALEQPELVTQALETLSSHLRAEPGPYMLDVINGMAGAIPPLLKLHSRYSRPELLERAITLGDRLLSLANPRDAGWSWTTMQPVSGSNAPDLTGFSHGTAGIVWALLELHRSTGRSDFLEAAMQGIRYEQSWFQSDVENWPDFRGQPVTRPDGTARYNCALAWCHGAPGIALGRLRAYQITRDPEIRAQAEAAVRSTARALAASIPGQESYCLCHGAGGNAESLIYASRVLGERTYMRAAEQSGVRGIELYHRAGLNWPCGVTGGGMNPSLLIGLAGIGYFYLRLYDEARFPSVLIPGDSSI
ncbi:MAG: lanthionine synthetase LanC family protein [Bryobacteraceae bacterium]